MFTGIIEEMGFVKQLKQVGTNLEIYLESPLKPHLKIDQSLAHNGVCLTVDEIHEVVYRVTAVEETLKKTNLGNLQEGSWVNLERSMTLEQRLDGHLVQGHVDQTGTCLSVEEKDGSWVFDFGYQSLHDQQVVEKGSICINGVSLTVVNARDNAFSVAIIPYTYQHTNFKNLNAGDPVNLEFDIIGKYVFTYLSKINQLRN